MKMMFKKIISVDRAIVVTPVKIMNPHLIAQEKTNSVSTVRKKINLKMECRIAGTRE